MSDRMTPIPFGELMNWILEERKQGSVFGIRRPFSAPKGKLLDLFGEHLETPFGPAAGPHGSHHTGALSPLGVVVLVLGQGLVMPGLLQSFEVFLAAKALSRRTSSYSFNSNCDFPPARRWPARP